MCGGEDSQELIDQNKVDQMNTQILGEKKIDANSYKVQPWATSSLNDSNKIESISAVPVTSVLGQSSDYLGQADPSLRRQQTMVSISSVLHSSLTNPARIRTGPLWTFGTAIPRRPHSRSIEHPLGKSDITDGHDSCRPEGCRLLRD